MVIFALRRQDHALRTRTFSKVPSIIEYVYALRKARGVVWIFITDESMSLLSYRYDQKRLDNLNTSRILFAVIYNFYAYVY